MSFEKRKWTISICLLLLGCSHSASENSINQADQLFQNRKDYTLFGNSSSGKKTLNISSFIRANLDSGSLIKARDSLLNNFFYLYLDGKGTIYISSGGPAVVIYTAMLKLQTKAVRFQIDAYAGSPGESLKIKDGILIASKAYPSDFPSTDTLQRGEMLLINRDIDLMEKETFDTTKSERK